MTSGETVLDANEIESILDFTRTDDAKCFLKAPGAETYDEFSFRTKSSPTEDKTFWINLGGSASANKNTYKIWFCVSANDTRITKDTFKKIGFNLYLVLKNPIEEIITDDFIGVWDSFKSVYNKNSVIFVNGIDNHNLKMSNIENGIGHSVRDALSNNDFTTALKNKLDGIEPNATASPKVINIYCENQLDERIAKWRDKSLFNEYTDEGLYYFSLGYKINDDASSLVGEIYNALLLVNTSEDGGGDEVRQTLIIDGRIYTISFFWSGTEKIPEWQEIYVSQTDIDNAIGDVEKSLENIIAKYGLNNENLLDEAIILADQYINEVSE